MIDENINNKASPKYDRWVDEQEIGISVDTNGMQSNEIEPIIERAKNDLGIVFNVMPAEYRDFIKKHTKELKLCELSRQSTGVYGKLSCYLTDWRSRPLQAIIRHDYFYRPNATNNDERGFEFKVIIEDSKTDELIVMPSHAFHPGRYAGDKKMWNLSMQKKQAEEFRNAVREQITLRLKVYGG